MVDNESHEGTRSLLGKYASAGKIRTRKDTQKNFRYLVKLKNSSDSYYQGGASYSSNLGTAILEKLPSWIPEKGDCSHEVIRSDNLKFKEILRKELSGYSNVNGLQRQIEDLEWKVGIMKNNRDLILNCLEDENTLFE